MTALYDRIGRNYSVHRQTDPVIAAQIHAQLAGARRIVNIGAGTGSYEPAGVPLVAVEPSMAMIRQRTAAMAACLHAGAERLPLADRACSHAMSILSMHHWHDRAAAFGDIQRVATERFVTVTWDPDSEPFWLVRDYFPEIGAMDRAIFPTMDELRAAFAAVEIQPLNIPADCRDAFLAAHWKRPAAYLEQAVRLSTSAFAKLGDVSEPLRRLESDIASGQWVERNAELLERDGFDAGYRLVVASL